MSRCQAASKQPASAKASQAWMFSPAGQAWLQGGRAGCQTGSRVRTGPVPVFREIRLWGHIQLYAHTLLSSCWVTGPIRMHLIPCCQGRRWPEREEAKASETGSWFDDGPFFVRHGGSGSINVALYEAFPPGYDPDHMAPLTCTDQAPPRLPPMMGGKRGLPHGAGIVILPSSRNRHSTRTLTCPASPAYISTPSNRRRACR